MRDERNVVDEFKGVPQDDIVAELDARGIELEIAIENLERDFNMGSIVRTANAFGVRHVHVVGRRQWNKRGAMATDTYMHTHYHTSVEAFMEVMNGRSRPVIAVDNVDGASEIHLTQLPLDATLVFGSESHGLSTEMLESCQATVMIRQTGSTRSMNVGAAAAVAMYEWVRQHA